MAAEVTFEVVQIGLQADHGTPVAATTRLAVAPGAIISLDRAYDSPDEDYGGISRHRPGRGNYGVRASEIPLNGRLTFEQFMILCESHFAGGVTPTGAGPYVWPYPADETTDTLTRLSIEAGTTDNALNQWLIADALVNELTASFDALSAPGNSPWDVQATAIGKNRAVQAFTESLSVPADLETAEGHLTQLFEGSTATAFASLAELADSLISFELRSNLNLKRRVRGSASSDTFSVYGRGKRETQVRAMVAIGSTADTDIHDIFNAAGSVAQERRWRTKINGSGTKVITFDFRPRFTGLPLEDNDGEIVYSVEADCVYDATLGTDVQATITNSVASL